MRLKQLSGKFWGPLSQDSSALKNANMLGASTCVYLDPPKFLPLLSQFPPKSVLWWFSIWFVFGATPRVRSYSWQVRLGIAPSSAQGTQWSNPGFSHSKHVHPLSCLPNTDHPHFTDKDTNVQRSYKVLRITQLVRRQCSCSNPHPMLSDPSSYFQI